MRRTALQYFKLCFASSKSSNSNSTVPGKVASQRVILFIHRLTDTCPTSPFRTVHATFTALGSPDGLRCEQTLPFYSPVIRLSTVISSITLTSVDFRTENLSAYPASPCERRYRLPGGAWLPRLLSGLRHLIPLGT